MGWTSYVILILFGLFILLAILNPNFSCFGKRIQSPFYPLLRKKKKKKRIEAEDYDFYLVDEGKKRDKQDAGDRKTSFPEEGNSVQNQSKKKQKWKKEAEVHSGFDVDSE